jgi:hypothetical protein
MKFEADISCQFFFVKLTLNKINGEEKFVCRQNFKNMTSDKKVQQKVIRSRFFIFSETRYIIV